MTYFMPDDVQAVAAAVVDEARMEFNVRCVTRPEAFAGAMAEVERREASFANQARSGGILPALTPRLAALKSVYHDATKGEEWRVS